MTLLLITLRNSPYHLRGTECQTCPGCGLSQTAVYLVTDAQSSVWTRMSSSLQYLLSLSNFVYLSVWVFLPAPPLSVFFSSVQPFPAQTWLSMPGSFQWLPLFPGKPPVERNYCYNKTLVDYVHSSRVNGHKFYLLCFLGLFLFPPLFLFLPIFHHINNCVKFLLNSCNQGEDHHHAQVFFCLWTQTYTATFHQLSKNSSTLFFCNKEMERGLMSPTFRLLLLLCSLRSLESLEMFHLWSFFSSHKTYKIESKVTFVIKCRTLPLLLLISLFGHSFSFNVFLYF